MENFMTRTTSTSIHFDKETFLKTSKKLTKEIQEYFNGKSNKTDENLFPLSAVQDLQAKALGFRNTDAILSFFDKPQIIKQSIEKKKVFLQDWSKEDIVSMFNLMLENNGGVDLWTKRAMTLISTVVEVIDHLRETKKITFNINCVQKYLNLNNLFDVYKEPDTLTEDIKEIVLNYLSGLPGFNAKAPKQSETTIEQHGYLQMQFSHILKVLKQVETNDVLIISAKWYRAVYCSTPYSEPTFFHQSINKSVLKNIYDEFPTEDWVDCFQNEKFGLKTKIKDAEYYFTGFKLIPEIKNHPNADNSWLKDDMFKLILKSLIEYKELKDYYLSDLLLKSFSIINEKKRRLYTDFICNLLKSYTIVVGMSKELDELSK
jgi:hypothetical protein